MNEYITKFWNEVKESGEQLRTQPMPELTQEAFYLFQQTGNRLTYENAYFGRRKYLTVFGILAEFGDDREDTAYLAQIIDSVCEEQFWALPAHVNFEHLDENTIDLFAAETAQTLSEMVYLFYDSLPEKTRKKALQEILRRVIAPFVKATFPYSWWETDHCNWSAVCAGSIGMTAIYIDKLCKEKQDSYLIEQCKKLPQNWMQACIARVCNALQCYLDGMEEDGACTEGLGYFSYGMSYFTGFVELYEKEYADTQEILHFMQQPKCEKIAMFQQKCYFGKGVSLSFSDGSQQENFLPGLTSYLQACFPKVEMPETSLARYLDGDACYRWLTNERNLRWTRQYGQRDGLKETMKAESAAYYLPSAQWMIVQDQHKNGYAIKGGHNAENHNHNDVGSFLCVYEGEMLLADLGAGEYTKDYFGEGRYQILCNRSLGHNVPIINGKEQSAGKQFCADSFLWDEAQQTLQVSFANAYEAGLVERLDRTIQWRQPQHGMEEMLITDSFTTSPKTETLTENLVTMYPPQIKEGNIIIEGNAVCCIINITLSHGDVPDFEVIRKEHSLHDGKKTDVYLIQWQLHDRIQKKITCQMRVKFQKTRSLT